MSHYPFKNSWMKLCHCLATDKIYKSIPDGIQYLQNKSCCVLVVALVLSRFKQVLQMSEHERSQIVKFEVALSYKNYLNGLRHFTTFSATGGGGNVIPYPIKQC